MIKSLGSHLLWLLVKHGKFYDRAGMTMINPTSFKHSKTFSPGIFFLQHSERVRKVVSFPFIFVFETNDQVITVTVTHDGVMVRLHVSQISGPVFVIRQVCVLFLFSSAISFLHSSFSNHKKYACKNSDLVDLLVKKKKRLSKPEF